MSSIPRENGRALVVLNPHLFPMILTSPPQRAPNCSGPFVECPHCMHTFSKDNADNHCTFPDGTKRKVKDLRAIVTKENCSSDDESTD